MNSLAASSGRPASPRRPSSRQRSGRAGMTLIEILVATTVLAVIMAMLLAMTNQTGRIWKGTTAKIEVFQNARIANHTLAQRLSQATLNPYLDYYDAANQPRNPNAASFVPAYYARNAELHFTTDQASVLVPDNGSPHPGQAVFFVAPLGFTPSPASFGGLAQALNACGYFVEFNSDAGAIPPFLAGKTSPRWRYRLMEFLQPTEDLTIYSQPSTGPAASYRKWFTDYLPPNAAVSPLRVIAENVIALAILPQLPPDAPGTPLPASFVYDTRAGLPKDLNHHQLPPLLRIVMIAIDEPSAQRLASSSGATPPPAIVQALANRFVTATELDGDIVKVSESLADAHVVFRVFDTTIALRGAKWSRE